MRSLVTTTLIASLATAATASAAARDGFYNAGTQKTGTLVATKNDRFDVRRIAFTEHCKAGDRSFDEPIKFVKGSDASISGPIKASGRFSGRYESKGTVFVVKGRFRGDHAKIVGSEHGSFQDESGDTVTCHGSHTFRAHFVDVTGG